jgi:hypothetical protein
MYTLAGFSGVVVLYALALPVEVLPVTEAVLQIPLVLLPFSAAAHALDRGGNWLAGVLWSAGLLLAGWGALQAGRDVGTIELGAETNLIESYAQRRGAGTVPMHLGGALTTVQTPEGLALRLGIQDHELGSAVLPDTAGAEADVGPWAMHVAHRGLPAGPSAGRLRLTHRTDKTVVEQIVPQGSGGTLPDGTAYGITRLSGDFGRALGGAAQISLTWGPNTATAWVFVEAPTMDARLSKAPWTVELLEVIAGPQTTLGVRRRGPTWAALAGLILMMLGVLVGLREETA